MTPQRFTDALSGADGTQALRLRYDVPPVYPDATVPVAAVRPVAVPIVTVRIPPIDPRVAAAVAERAVVRPPTRPRPTAPAPNRAQAVRAPAPPSRAQAARAGYFQGPVPTAIGPAAPSQHRSFPAAPSMNLQGAADRLCSQLGQFGTGNARSQPAMPSSPQAGRRSSEPASVFQPAPSARRRSNRLSVVLQIAVALFILFMFAGSLGSEIVQWIGGLFQR